MTRNIIIDGKSYYVPKHLSHLSDEDFTKMIKSLPKLSFFSVLGVCILLGVCTLLALISATFFVGPWVYGIYKIVS
jgi:hypothetical protein